jgi:hypothetical protein
MSGPLQPPGRYKAFAQALHFFRNPCALSQGRGSEKANVAYNVQTAA